MKSFNKRSYLLLLLFFALCPSLLAWGGETHKRMTYWGWYYAKLPPSSGSVTVPVVWNLDSVQAVLGFQGYDMMSFLTYLFTAATGANFNIDTIGTIQASTTDSALFYEWGRKPDDFDAPAEAAGGAQFGHMYIPTGGGFADGMCKFFFDKAVRIAKANKSSPESLRVAYGYLALAAHYIEDVGFPPHNEKNYLDPGADIWQANYHHTIESWIGDSANWYRYFDETCDSFARAALPACDPVTAIHSLAWECTWYDQDFKDAAVKADKSDLIDVCRKCFRAILPRVTGLFVSFKARAGL